MADIEPNRQTGRSYRNILRALLHVSGHDNSSVAILYPDGSAAACRVHMDMFRAMTAPLQNFARVVYSSNRVEFNNGSRIYLLNPSSGEIRGLRFALYLTDDTWYETHYSDKMERLFRQVQMCTNVQKGLDPQASA